MPPIPRDTALDNSLAFIRDPYRFVSKQCRRYGADLFETRLLLRRTICMTGPAAAELFYDANRFSRHDAMPAPIRRTLLGQGGVQGLDDGEHRNRKRMLMSLMGPERIGQLTEAVSAEWLRAGRAWAARREIVLYDELPGLLTRAVCAWAGVPLGDREAARRTRQLRAMFDGAGAVGPRHLWSRLSRKNANRWIAGIVGEIRAGRLHPPDGSAAHVVAWHRQLDGALLSPHVAAVELLNVLRPTVAVAVYITFIAHALHQHPEVRRKLLAGEPGYTRLFVQEVRRLYPFFPAVMANVRHDFEWRGYRFTRGRKAVLDLFGTNHDARTWDAPEEFRPERFRDWYGSPFDFIPQGGGDYVADHRCAGEWITIELMEMAADMLGRRMGYDVPDQDLRINFARLPALPRSRFIMRNVSFAELGEAVRPASPT